MTTTDRAPRVLNKRDYKDKPLPPNAVYVGRPSQWGNPWQLKSRDPRDRVYACQLFEEYALERLAEEPAWLAPLVGKDLVCWCAPLQCHAETLLRLANRPLAVVRS